MCQSNVLRAADCSLGSNGCCCILNLSLDSFSSLCRHVSQMNLDMKICQSFKDILLPSFANYKLYKITSTQTSIDPSWCKAMARGTPPSWPPAPLWVWVATTFFSEGGFEPWDRSDWLHCQHLLDHCIKFLFLRRLRCPRRVRRVPMSKSVLRLMSMLKPSRFRSRMAAFTSCDTWEFGTCIGDIQWCCNICKVSIRFQYSCFEKNWKSGFLERIGRNVLASNPSNPSNLICECHHLSSAVLIHAKLIPSCNLLRQVIDGYPGMWPGGLQDVIHPTLVSWSAKTWPQVRKC